jgi:hypothetical protein
VTKKFSFYLLAPEPTLLASVMSADVLQVLQWMVVFVIWIFLVTCVEPDELPLH